MKNLISLFSILLFCISLSINSGCADSHAVENAKLDSLEIHLEAAEQFLEIDIELLKARVQEISANRDYVLREKKDTFSYELGANLDKYKAVMRIYEANIEAYNKWVTELDELNEQVSNLRLAVGSDEIDGEKFKEYYYKEEQDVLALRTGSQNMQKSLYEIEPEFNRLSKYFDEVIEDLKAD